MKTTLPYCFFIAALFLIGVDNAGKEQFPDTFGRFAILHLGCAMVSAALFSLGILLSLRGVFLAKKKRWQFLLPLFCNSAAVVAILALYFLGYAVTTKVLLLSGDTEIRVEQKLIADIQEGMTETKRKQDAQMAYRLYGHNLVYRRDSNDFVQYVPTADDSRVWAEHQRMIATTRSAKAQMQETIAQFPYLFAFYLGTVFITFVVGVLWFTFQEPASSKSS